MDFDSTALIYSLFLITMTVDVLLLLIIWFLILIFVGVAVGMCFVVAHFLSVRYRCLMQL